MKTLLRVEELAMLVLAIYLNTHLLFSGWVFWALFLAPDLGMLGYLVSPKIGAITYNLTHHKAVAIALYLSGYFLIAPVLTLAGVVMFAHSSFDRIVGYGLKFNNDFKHTHLGWIGKNLSGEAYPSPLERGQG